MLLNHHGFKAAFYSCSVIPLVGLISVLFRLITIQPASTEIGISTSSCARLRQPAVFARFNSAFILYLGSGTIFTFMPLHSQGLGINETMAGIIIATVYSGSALLRVPRGKLSAIIGRSQVILLGLMTSFATMLLISVMNFFSSLITAAIFYGASMGIAMPAACALVAELNPLEMKGLSTGMNSSFLHGGLVSDPKIMGVAASMNNYATMFRACSLSLILGIIVVLSLTGKRR